MTESAQQAMSILRDGSHFSWYVIPIRWMRLLSFLARRITGFRSRKLVVDGGRVVESGDPAALASAETRYHDLLDQRARWICG